MIYVRVGVWPDSIAHLAEVMKALIEMLGVLGSSDLLVRTDVTSEALMRFMRIRRGLSTYGLNLPRRVQSQIDWSDTSKDNEFRMLHGGIGYVFCRMRL